ncbi:LPS O-antigen length regulator [Alteromonas mediterranea]|uniref:LPS O-antigen length regulator n=1 Tax=Alteromonas mediterranea TaxID=314275 RepID=A0AAC9NT95_9ALTE|nr:LPS O-antigen length regulator [Alteromonas mediterranea]APE03955.1 LPS O-antigen length regulator [Alteromonas mediterranea]
MNITNESLSSRGNSEDEIDLKELVSVIWKEKVLVIAVASLFAVLSVIYAIKQPNIYKSEVLLAPSEQEGSGGLAGLAGQFGGLASLAGVNLGGGSNKAQLAVEVLKSRQFTSDFINKHNILPELMGVHSWNMQKNELIYDEELYDGESGEWTRVVTAPLVPEPSMQEAYKEFKKVFSVNNDKETGLITLSVSHVSPYVAKQWVSWLVEDINQTMKEREVLEAKKSTEFLQHQLNQTEIADIREVLYKLVEEQTKTIMFAEVRDEYVFKTIDAAFVPEEKFRPKRAVIAILGTILGCIAGVIFAFIVNFSKKQRSKSF